MKAICIRENNLKEISMEVSKKKLKELKSWAKLSKMTGEQFFFIPWYEHPLAAGIPRLFIVPESYMYKYFSSSGFYPDSYWMHIQPK